MTVICENETCAFNGVKGRCKRDCISLTYTCNNYEDPDKLAGTIGTYWERISVRNEYGENREYRRQAVGVRLEKDGIVMYAPYIGEDVDEKSLVYVTEEFTGILINYNELPDMRKALEDLTSDSAYTPLSDLLDYDKIHISQVSMRATEETDDDELPF